MKFKNVYFINGKDLMKYCGNEGTAENTHPNDLGFYSMGKVLGDLIEEILNKWVFMKRLIAADKGFYKKVAKIAIPIALH